jgi:hypothetical protein
MCARSRHVAPLLYPASLHPKHHWSRRSSSPPSRAGLHLDLTPATTRVFSIHIDVCFIPHGWPPTSAIPGHPLPRPPPTRAPHRHTAPPQPISLHPHLSSGLTKLTPQRSTLPPWTVPRELPSVLFLPQIEPPPPPRAIAPLLLRLSPPACLLRLAAAGRRHGSELPCFGHGPLRPAQVVGPAWCAWPM